MWWSISDCTQWSVQYYSSYVWLIPANTMSSSSVHSVAHGRNSQFIAKQSVWCSSSTHPLVDPHVDSHTWAFRNSSEISWAYRQSLMDWFCSFWIYTQQWNYWMVWEVPMFYFVLENFHTVLHRCMLQYIPASNVSRILVGTYLCLLT